MNKLEELRRFASYYSSIGFSVIPVARSKIPLISSWQRRKIAEPADVQAWLSTYPDMNLGVVTGSVSNLAILDVDVKNGEDGLESLRQLEKEFGPLPETPIARTTTGGEHYYFRYNGPALRRSIRFRPGLDLLAEDSYAVLPPSVGKNGRAYAWDVDAHLEDVALASLPSWIVELSQKTTFSRPNDWSALAFSGATEGSRNQTLTKLAGHLFRRFVDPHLVRELLLAFNQRRVSPPLEEREVVGICDSIARKEFQRRLSQSGELQNG